MSPSTSTIEGAWGSFPRVSGDEPGITLVFLPLDRFSPRERG